ncbi:ABC-type phosphate transport system substrate-binding protein [Asanoa ferruginea]|uniref:ABC-type phosphate transport system substrate-binding protein n=1 Tax=Asanoa ferruginea TaxID=53367 RepID=A0A3D9ZG73_9ACTN|nr:ABC-type phosphate transport system substrate-binding protein [Asanoa ferruginea]GIF53821.1 phosphate ABC transporter substrate-binding protein PstS [Asanoa ferruginea]
MVLLGSLVAWPSPADAAPRRVPINGAGSTSSSNLIDMWRRDVLPNQLFVNYQPTGSTDGRRQFAEGTVDFAASQVPYGLGGEPLPSRQFTYVPAVGSGLAFTYNLRANGKQISNLRVSGDVIVKIFTGGIRRWDDPLIAADNPGITLPARDIVSVVRQDSAGNSLQLTRWMSTHYPDQWQAFCQASGGTPPCAATAVFPTAGHVAMQGATGVAGYVAQADGTIGYVDYQYAIGARLPVAKVLNQAGYYVGPRADAVAVGLTGDPDADRRAYPFSTYSFLVVPTVLERGLTVDKGYTLAQFAQYAVCAGQQTADVLGYAPLPINLAREAMEQIRRIPGAEVPTDPIAGCDNPTFAPDGTNTLLANAPQPPECDNRASGQQCAGPSNAIATSTELTVSSTAVNPGDRVTLTATVGPVGVAGYVQFLRGPGGVPIGSPVEVVGGVTAQLTTYTLPPGSYDLTARLEPADPTRYAMSTSAPVRITVGDTPAAGNTVAITADIAPGAFSLTTASSTAELAGGSVGGSATGALPEVTVVDLRGTNAGWYVTAQVGDFDNEGVTIPGAQLGWTPSASKVGGSGAVLSGGAVVPGTTSGGLAEGVTLCSGPPQSSAGTFHCGADLRLDIPDTTAPGLYAATLTLTLA